MYGERRKRVLDEMEAAGLSQLLLSDPYSIFYLTGLANFAALERFWGLLLRKDREPVIFSNKLFCIGPTQLKVVTLDDADDVEESVASYVEDGVLGVDKNLPARRMIPLLEKKKDLTVRLGSGCVDKIRGCKDAAEQKLMRRASRINDACLEKTAAFIRTGVTEKACSDYLHRCYEAYGCEGLAFPPIVSFGANAADPHHEPDGTVVREGDCIVIDIGCRKDGYCSDMTRTYFWKKADPRFAAIHDTVRQANEMAEAAVRPGIRFCELDAMAREHIAQAGYGPYFTHRLGHFIGMEDHESGDVSSRNTDFVRENQIFSIEPGVYLPGEFGVRIEDLVLATEGGCEVLNRLDRNFRILDDR